MQPHRLLSILRYLSHQDISLDAPFDGESSRTYADLIPSPAPPLEERLAEEELSRLCGEKFQCFSETIGPRERQILEQRLLAETPMTLREIGEKHGVTRETVRQTEKKLLKKLRTHLAQELPKSPMALWGTFFLEKVQGGKSRGLTPASPGSRVVARNDSNRFSPITIYVMV